MIIIKKGLNTIALTLNQLCSHPLLTLDEERKLFERLKQEEDVKNEIARCNIRLIVDVAKRHCYGNMDLFMDNIQEGFLGLNRAIEKFDYKRGYKFSTYATWWIRQFILRNLPKNMADRNIRLPIHVFQKINTLKRVYEQFIREFHRPPTKDELVERTGFSEEKIIHLLQLSGNTSSFDREIDEDDSTEFLDLIPCNDEGPENLALIREIKEKLPAFISPFINGREKEVLQQRFFNEWTLDQVGSHFGFTRERARQIEFDALRKLRKEKEKLKDLNPVGAG